MKNLFLLRRLFLLLPFLFLSTVVYTQVKKNVTVPPKKAETLSKSDIDKSIYRDVQKILNEKSVMDQVIPDDLVVQGSGCFGFDCVNNESFGFDTIRLKENNTRIGFNDTSVGAFPTNDWEIEANSSASGGLSSFSILDITGAKIPFRIEAGAKTSALYVASSGRIGVGTSTPVLDVNIKTSNTPAVRLEQDASGGFSAQTWDMAGNEANFFIRDVTSGSRLPFRIRPGAPTSSIDIQNDGTIKIVNAIVPNSDARLKKNFAKIDNAVGIIGQLNPLRYDFRYDELKELGLPKTRQFGLVAQDVEKILPELVSQGAEENGKVGYKGVNYTGLIPILIKAMQEQQTEIESLKKKVGEYEALNARISHLEAMLNNEEKLKVTDKK